jgi:DNA-directed RNA polymerase alpha subunit
LRFIEGLTLDEIGEKLNITRERIRQIYNKSLLHIRLRLEILSTEYLLLESFKNDLITLEAENAQLRKKIEYYENILPSTEIDILETHIQTTALSIRAKNCLRAAKIKTLKDLTRYTKTDILSLQQIGQRTVMEIEFYMASCGLKFKE